MFTITWSDKDLNAAVTKAQEAAPKETRKAVRAILLDLAGKSARQAPIETGDLRNDCTARLNGATIFSRQAAVLSGGLPAVSLYGEVFYTLPYARRQHEDLTLNHTRTDGHLRSNGQSVNMVAGGNAKFLEKPYNQNLPKYTARLNKIIDKALNPKGGGGDTE